MKKNINNSTEIEDSKMEEKEQKRVAEPEDKLKEYDLSKLPELIQLFMDKVDQKGIKKEIVRYINTRVKKYKLENYHIIFLFDEFTTLSSYEADRIYQSLNSLSNDKNILLILSNHGGKIEPAYLISQTCKKSTKEKFIVAIPRKAKSAATLLALGADEIHMGMMSELGPIDPQIEGLPALGLGNALEYIANIVCQYPESSTMFAEYLSSKLELNTLGYFERVSESAKQYAERLIGNKKLPKDETAETISRKLVYDYKDHSFVIDMEEAKSLLGTAIVQENTVEYNFANEIYSVFSQLSLYIDFTMEKRFTYVGDISKGFNLHEKR